MKEYLGRINCFYTFEAEQDFICKNKKTRHITMGVLYKVFDLNTEKEILFKNFNSNEILGVVREVKKTDELEFGYINVISFGECVKVFLDKNSGYIIKMNDDLLKKIGYRIEYEVHTYLRKIRWGDTKEISENTFLKTLKENYELFETAKDDDEKLNLPIINYNIYYSKEDCLKVNYNKLGI